MAETSVHGAIRRESTGGDRPNRAKRSRIPPSMSPRDLISDLPDAVIHHIFSFLPLRDVVKTSALSKRWQSTWTTTTQLVFNDAYSSDFTSLVDSVLIRCTSPAVKRFHITPSRYDEACHPKLDLWLRFAEERCVEDLRLCLDAQREFFYKLPGFLYCLSRLARLEVYTCCFSLGTTVRWPCLKVLLIRYAEMSDDILEGIVRGSPVLESLELHNCRGVKNIVIDSTSLKELIVFNDHSQLSKLEKIWAPHLLSLRILGCWLLGSVFRLHDISSLVEAGLDFMVSHEGIGRDLLKGLLEKLCRVSTITIGDWCLKVLSALEMEGVSSPFSKCQNLILRVPVGQSELPGIAYILRSSQCLEKLVIHLTHTCIFMFELDEEFIEHFDEDLLCSRKGNFQCLAKHLRSVEINDFAYGFESKHLLTLIKFLLGDALALEKMIIKANLHAQLVQKRLRVADLCELLGVSRNVLSYRRASQNAEVIFDYPLEEVSIEKHRKKILDSKRG